MNRKPAVAGRFYPRDTSALMEEIRRHVEEGVEKVPVVGVVSPHAGFMYSGDVAGAVYSRIDIPDTVILIGPNHTGDGEAVSVMTEGTWLMPFGELDVDHELAQAICSGSPLLREDTRAHVYEHSLETQLPFLQYFRKDFRIVPICLMHISLDQCTEVSKAVVSGIKKLGRQALIVASSDMTHYESHDSASAKDKRAIDRILKLDARGLFETVRDSHISMCGVNPVTVMLMAADNMGAHEAKLVRYMTSGEVSGDMDHVVGYAGVIVS